MTNVIRLYPEPVPAPESVESRFTQDYTDHAARVRRIVLGELRHGDVAQADDLTQDVWLTYWRHLTAGRDVQRPAALLATIARHRVCDHYRLARVRREVSVDPQEYGPISRLAADLAAVA